jgi:outer membrane lipoprotein-sorting protein
MRTLARVLLSLALMALGAMPAARAEERTPAQLSSKIIDDMENLMRGKASVGEMEMYIKRWDRTLTMKFQEVYPDKSLVRLTAPAEDAGMASLKLGKDLWAYNPKIDQVQKIPPSLMLDSWMGSDFTNDDISRSSSVKLDYDVLPAEAGKVGSTPTWRVTLKPKPSSPVVWEKEVLEVAQDDLRPLRQEFYDEKGNLARVMHFSDYRKMNDGRNYPFLWKMENLQDSGRYTEIRVKKMEFVESLPDKTFTIRSLKKGR